MIENGALFQENSRSTKARFFSKDEIALDKFVSNYPVVNFENLGVIDKR